MILYCVALYVFGVLIMLFLKNIIKTKKKYVKIFALLAFVMSNVVEFLRLYDVWIFENKDFTICIRILFMSIFLTYLTLYEMRKDKTEDKKGVVER
ncbi:MAG: hypothetical protein IJO50_04055 [Clostridia bacterium]|nr:hypothetical protein [Clostridia bacterium]